MPVMDGIQATKEIRMMEKMNSSSGFPLSTPRSEGPLRTPSEAPSSTSPYRSSVIIVALTASSLQSDRVAALAAGCNDFLTKPVSLQWLNNKIIEWGSIKALQMWADLRPEVVKSISTGQTAQAHKVARRLHVPEGRTTPTSSPSRSLSRPRTTTLPDAVSMTTAMEMSSSAIVQQPVFPAKDDYSDSPSSDNPVSDSELPRSGG
jgi:osomolarity two-component system response regulator SSK1